jgi:hypothetical protein
VTGSIGELVTNWNMWVGGAVGVAVALVLTFVLDNIVWIGLGVAVLTVAAIVWRGRRALAEHRAAPQSALWTPDKARTAPRRAIAAPARAALPASPQRALPAARPAMNPDLARSLTELGAVVMAAKAARPAAAKGR